MPESTETTHTTTEPQFQCRHIFPEGRRCRSCSLRGERFCYFHHTTRKPIAKETRQRRSRKSAFTLPAPEDHLSIQHAIGLIVERIAANELDTKRAGLLLYALQIATQNLPKQVETKERTIREVTEDPDFGTLAPETQLPEEEKERDLEAWLLEGWTPLGWKPKGVTMEQMEKMAERDKQRAVDLQAVAEPLETHPRYEPKPNPSNILRNNTGGCGVPRKTSARRQGPQPLQARFDHRKPQHLSAASSSDGANQRQPARTGTATPVEPARDLLHPFLGTH